MRAVVIAANRFAALAALLAAVSAAAADNSRFARVDTDRNGTLSRAEVERGRPKLAPHFDEIDRNHDGKLSPDELERWSRKRDAAKQSGGFAEHFRRADADGDGGLTRTEADKALPAARREIRPHRHEPRRQAHRGRAAAILRRAAVGARKAVRRLT